VAKYWMSQVGNGGTEVASGGGYFLYSNATAGNVADIELTPEEAAVASACRVFVDYSGKTIEERAVLTDPIVKADGDALEDVTRLVRGYFHSQDLTLPEISAKMALYGDALAAAAAGSVELTLALMQQLTIPSASSSGSFPYDPNYVYNGSSHDSSHENYYSGSAPRDAYGIEEIGFSGSFITIHFVDTASMNAWRAQPQTFEVVCPSGSYSWEKPLTLDASAEYTTSYYNYVSYDLDGQLTSAEKAELADIAASIGGSPFNIEINNAGQSPATALGETDVVAKVITDLSLHLLKFPR